jgi:hypothetical protein
VGADQGGHVSLSDHRYVARIAPVSATAVDAIRAGAIVIDERGQRVTESFASGGLIWPTKPCPILIDHDERFPVGFVSDFAERGGWNEATFVLDMDKRLSDVACELLRVGTPVSLGFMSLRTDESFADLGFATPVERHTVSILREVSILAPGTAPAYRGAKVVRITERGTALDRMRERERAEAKPKARASAARASAWPPGAIVRDLPDGSQEITYTPGTLARRNIGRVLSVTDEYGHTLVFE